MVNMQCLLLLLIVTGLESVLADTPANCLYDDIVGTWTFSESSRTGDSSITCKDLGKPVYTKEFTLSFPNTATDELGNAGTWTMIYNQGFEINIDLRSYFAYFYYEGNLAHSTSYCNKTMVGWARDKTVRNWSCFQASKNTLVAPRVTERRIPSFPSRHFVNDHKLIDKINSVQSLWRAKAYPELEKYTVEEVFIRAGGASGIRPRSSPFPATKEQKARASLLPDNFDWRNLAGVNYVSPVRDQGSCGSCYAFASMASLEARIRIATGNQRQDIFSVQDILDCSHLSEGCLGGLGFLVAGRFSEDQGVIAESCNPYKGTSISGCNRDPSCSITYVGDYTYVGGFFGACNEELMMEAVFTHGPITAAFMVYDDFYNYDGGVYKHTQLRSDFNPLEATNHEVLIVGYGVDEVTGEKFWTVKNSWGPNWGEDGFFRVLRGVDECGIESESVSAIPIP